MLVESGADYYRHEVHGPALLAGGIGKAVCAPRPVGLRGDVLADVGQVVRTVGILHVSPQVCALAHERHAPPHQVSGGPHLGGIPRGVGAHALAKRPGKPQALRDVGAEYVLLNSAGGPPSLRRFAQEIMPAFADAHRS